MPGGILNLDGQTIFRSNNGIIEIPPNTFIRGISDLPDIRLNSASFDVQTSIITLTTSSGNNILVDISSMSTSLSEGATNDATALAIALG